MGVACVGLQWQPVKGELNEAVELPPDVHCVLAVRRGVAEEFDVVEDASEGLLGYLLLLKRPVMTSLTSLNGGP